MLLVPQLVSIPGLYRRTQPNARWPALIGIPFYFCMVNAAAWVGSLRGFPRRGARHVEEAGRRKRDQSYLRGSRWIGAPDSWRQVFGMEPAIRVENLSKRYQIGRG